MSIASHQLDAFAEVARSGSFSAAAKRLHITQSALSQRVLNLESELGQTLILREPSGLRLTDAGQELLRYCGTREALEAETLGRLRETPGNAATKASLSGTLRIAGYSTVLRSAIVPALAPLLRANPDVQLETMSRELAQLPPMLRTGEADFILLDRALEKPGILERRLGEEQYVLVESREHACPDDLFLDHDADDETTIRFLAQQGASKKTRKLRRSFLDDIYGLLDGVALGLGRAVVPLHLVRSDDRIRVAKGHRPLRIPVVLHHYEQPYYTRLQTAALEAIVEGAARALGA